MKKGIIAAGLLILLIGLLIWQFPYALKNPDTRGNLIYFLCLALAASFGCVSRENWNVQ